MGDQLAGLTISNSCHGEDEEPQRQAEKLGNNMVLILDGNSGKRCALVKTADLSCCRSLNKCLKQIRLPILL